jgi:hypothetical protein
LLSVGVVYEDLTTLTNYLSKRRYERSRQECPF